MLFQSVFKTKVSRLSPMLPSRHQREYSHSRHQCQYSFRHQHEYSHSRHQCQYQVHLGSSLGDGLGSSLGNSLGSRYSVNFSADTATVLPTISTFISSRKGAVLLKSNSKETRRNYISRRGKTPYLELLQK